MSRPACAAAILLLALTLLALPLSITATSNVTGKRIVLDPGHGGSDSGTTECPTLKEKVATLQIATLLRGMLEADGAIVTMTRTTDTTLSNNDRYTVANAANGEALVSIHLNSSTDHTINRNLGLWGKRNKDLEFTRTIHAQQLEALAPIENEGIRQFASGVLLKANMPAMIAESVYLSNTDECRSLSDGTMTRQTEIARSLYNGLNTWFRNH